MEQSVNEDFCVYASQQNHFAMGSAASESGVSELVAEAEYRDDFMTALDRHH